MQALTSQRPQSRVGRASRRGAPGLPYQWATLKQRFPGKVFLLKSGRWAPCLQNKSAEGLGMAVKRPAGKRDGRFESLWVTLLGQEQQATALGRVPLEGSHLWPASASPPPPASATEPSSTGCGPCCVLGLGLQPRNSFCSLKMEPPPGAR